MNNFITKKKKLKQKLILFFQFLVEYSDIISDIFLIKYFASVQIPKQKNHATELYLIIFTMTYSLLLERYETYKLLLNIKTEIKKKQI